MDERSSIEQNYREFKKNLSQHRFPKYEEPDLIEIFDVAGDYNDYYVQSEVLMLGARLYPESSELLQRRGYLYANLFPEVLSEFVDNNQECDGLCWDLLRLRDCNVDGVDAVPMLDRIINKYKELEDEDIIRLSELVREIKCEDWFIKNLKKLEKKAVYPDTVLYEVALTQHETGDEEGAVNTLERLTKIDPFRAENWILMAESYLNLGKFEEGLRAIEFARAVETVVPEADAVEGALLLGLNRNLTRAIELLEKYLELKPDSNSVIHNLSLAYVMAGLPEKGQAFLMDIFKRNPSNAFVLKELLATSPSNVKELIAIHLNSSPDASDIFSVIGENLREMVFSGNYKAAIALGRSIPDLAGRIGVVEYYLWAMMLDNDWDGLIDFYDDSVEKHEFYSNDSETLFFVAYACLNTGRLERAKDLAIKGIESINRTFNQHLSFRMNQYGCQQALSTLIRLVDYGNVEMIAQFDPLLVKGKG